MILSAPMMCYALIPYLLFIFAIADNLCELNIEENHFWLSIFDLKWIALTNVFGSV